MVLSRCPFPYPYFTTGFAIVMVLLHILSPSQGFSMITVGFPLSHLHQPPKLSKNTNGVARVLFYRLDAYAVAQPNMSKNRRQIFHIL